MMSCKGSNTLLLYSHCLRIVKEVTMEKRGGGITPEQMTQVGEVYSGLLQSRNIYIYTVYIGFLLDKISNLFIDIQ